MKKRYIVNLSVLRESGGMRNVGSYGAPADYRWIEPLTSADLLAVSAYLEALAKSPPVKANVTIGQMVLKVEVEDRDDENPSLFGFASR